MKILIINCILSTAEKGVITPKKSIWDCMISTFARGFIQLGHQVTLLASSEFKPTQEEDLPFEVVYFPSRLPRLFKPDLLPWPRGMGGWLKLNAQRYDLVIASESFQIATLIASVICPASRMLIWQEMVRHQRLLFKLPSRLWYNCVIPLFMSDVTIVPRSEPARQFVSRYSHHVSDVIVDHGTDGAVLYPSSDHDRSFVVVSRLVPGKNIDKIISTFARLVSLQEYHDYRLDIIGDGEQRQQLESQATRLGIEKNVVFHGFLSHEQLAQPMRRALALLVATSNDLNMLTIGESIASGTPVVTNTVPSTASFIAANKLGVVKDNWDENDLIYVISNHDQLHAACCEAGKGLSNTACASKMIEIHQVARHHH